MSVCKPHTIAVCRMYALRGYPGTRLDAGLSTYRRFAADGTTRQNHTYPPAPASESGDPPRFFDSDFQPPDVILSTKYPSDLSPRNG